MNAKPSSVKTRLLLTATMFLAALGVAFGLFELHPNAAQQELPVPVQDPVISTLDQAECLAFGDSKTALDRRTGAMRFVGTEPGRPIPNPRQRTLGSPEADARAYLSTCGRLFGVKDATTELRTMRVQRLNDRRSVLRFQQLHGGLPVMGSELIVHVDDAGNVITVGGKTLQQADVDTTVNVTAAVARNTALDVVEKTYGAARSTLVVSTPEAWIYNPNLFIPGSGPAVSVWRMEVTTRTLQPIRELVLVDQQRGAVVQHFNQIDTALSRQTYTANHSTTLPGTLVCSETDNTCAAGDEHAAGAHLNARDTYNFYLNTLGRDSIDGAGLIVKSTVRYSSNYQNAFWNGTQMVYGDGSGYPLADDVVGHELTHGVTQYTSNLFYLYQSGAINESLSDVFGEIIDQTNGRGNDTAGVKWLMGEDVTGLGAIRNMANPPAFGQPDKMTSANYYQGANDSGGVHTNSGINNKAAYLMVDGGTFNGRTVAPLGTTKVAKIYYEVETHLLTSGSDYADLYDALYQGCNNLVGTSSITVGDCQQVRIATDAVEMNLQPVANFNSDAPVCAPGNTPSNIFFDNMEGSGTWQVAALAGTQRWAYTTGYAHSGTRSLWGNDSPGTVSDSYVAMGSSVTIPANAYLRFAHAFDFDSPNYDGGVVEYSTNAGSTWTDAGSLFDTNGYRGALDTHYQNPLGGRQAFVNDSHGYISSRLNLSSLSGQSVRFRWRMGLDNVVAIFGWLLDDVRIYSCAISATATMNTPTVTAGGTIGFSVAGGPADIHDWVGLFPSGAGDGAYGNNWQYLNGLQTLPGTGLSGATLQFTAPSTPGTYNVRFFDNGVKMATSGLVTVQSQPTLSVNDVSVTEGNSGTANATFTVTLSPVNTTQTVTVNYATANGTATAPSDFTAASGTLTFNPSVATQTFTVAINGDATTEQNETFVVNLTSPANAIIGDNQGVGTITNDDFPTVTMTTPATVTSGGTIGFTVANGFALANDWVGLYPSAIAGPGSGYVDWLYLDGTRVIPGSGQASATLQFTAPETPGTYVVRLISSGAVVANSQVTVQARPTLTINNVSVAEGNSGTTTATFTVTLNPLNTTQTVTVDYATANGSATAGSDYTAAIGTLTFTPSTATQTISVSVNGDATYEANEVFAVNLTNPVNAVIGQSQGIGTITNDDLPVLTINDVSVPEGDSGTTPASFTVTLTPAATQTITVSYATADGTATTANSDYVAKSGTLTFAPGVTTQTIAVTVNGDLAFENNETFVVNLTAPANATISDAQGQGTIAGDDPPAPTMTVNTPNVNPGGAISVGFFGPSDTTDWVGLYATGAPDGLGYVDWEYLNAAKTVPPSPLSSGTLQFTAPMTTGTYEVRYFRRNTYTKTGTSGAITVALTPTLTINDASVTEGNSGAATATFTVTLSPVNTTQTVTVDFALADGTATAGSDYLTQTGTLTFFPTVSTQTVNVNVNGDTTYESNETFFVNLANAVNALMGDNQGTGTITNDDAPPGPSVTINTPSVSPGGTIGFTVANGPANATDWVALFASGAPDNTYVDWKYLSGTRTPPGTGLSGATVDFTAPTTTGTYNIRLFSNNTFTRLATSGTATVVPTPTLTINDVSVMEGDSGTTTATFTVTLSPLNTTQTVTVEYGTANGTATAGTDYVASSGTLTFTPSTATQTIDVTVNGDVTNESSETFLVNLTNAANAIIGDNEGVGTITNDDTPPGPSVTINTSNVNPGGTIGFTVANGPANAADWVALFSSTAADTTYVDWMYLNGSKTAPGAGLSGATLQFTAPALVGTYNIRLFANNTFTKLATSGLATVAALPTLTINDASLTEGNSGTTTATFTVTLSPLNTTQTVTVDYATANGTATSATDYLSTSGTLTFTPSTPTQSVSVTVNGDVTNESNETFFVNLTNPVNALIGDSQGIGTITNDDAPPAPSVTINTPNVNPGGTIDFSVANGPANATDWVALFSSAAADTTYVDWMYLNGSKTAPGTGVSSTTRQFTAPTPLGTYNIRLFSNNTFTKLATSGLATVAPTPTLTINDVTLAEGNTGTTTATFSVTLNPVNTTQTVTVAYATANNTAAAGSDYSSTSGTLTFPPSTATQTISVSVTGDTTVESAETFFVNLTTPTNAIIGDSQGVGTITNDDAPPGPSVTMLTPLVHWGGHFVFTVANGPANPTDYIAVYRVGAPDAAPYENYWMFLNASRTPPASGISNVTLQFEASTAMEGDYEVRLLTNGPLGSASTRLATSGTFTVPGPPTATIDDIAVTEGTSGTRIATFTVTVDPVSTTDSVIVNYATANGTATAGSDYVATSGALTFSLSQPTKTISVTVNGDMTPESDETFFVNLSPGGYARIGDAQGKATITEQMAPTVTMSTPNVNPGDSIDFSIANGPAHTTDWVGLFAHTAGEKKFVDWMYLNGSRTPPASGMSSATLHFVAPALPAGYEVRLFASNGYTKLATSGLATAPALPSLSINDATFFEGNAGTRTATFTVTLSPVNAAQTVTVNYATADGTAFAGSDYVAKSGTLTFSPSIATQTINVTLNSDTTNEDDETYFVRLSGAVNASISGSQGVGTISNEDPPAF